MQTSTTASPCCLDDVLAYRHEGVIRRYLKEHGGTQRQTEEVFRETLKWLYLCHKASEDGFACAITPELEKIDEMWHTFLLFTLDYADFCQRHFGTFIHHLPTEAEDEAVGEDEEAARTRLTVQYGLVYDLLGEQTLTAWYDDCLYALPA
jgi:hypothetical protein